MWHQFGKNSYRISKIAQTIFANEGSCVQFKIFHFNKIFYAGAVIYSHYCREANVIRKYKSWNTRIDVTREIFAFGHVMFSTNTVLSTPPGPKTRRVTYQTSDRRYIDIAVVKSLLLSEGERIDGSAASRSGQKSIWGVGSIAIQKIRVRALD